MPIDPNGITWDDGTSPKGIVWDDAPARSASETVNRYLALTGNSSNKAISGALDMFGNAPVNVWNLAKALAGTGATALGRPDLAPDITQTPDYARKAFSNSGLLKAENEPVTTGERLFDRTIQGGVGMFMNPASSVAQAAKLGAIGLGSGATAQGVTEATGSNALGDAAGLLTPLGIGSAANRSRLRASELAMQEKQNAPKNDAFRAAQAEGFVVTPSTMRPSFATQTLESIGGKIATQQEASLNNATQANTLAQRSIGLSPTEIATPEVTRAIRSKAYQDGYAPIENIGTISTGSAYRNDLNGIVEKYVGAERSFPGAGRGDVAEMVDALRKRTFDAGDGLKMSQVLREKASESFQKGDSGMGKAQRAASKAIEDQIERNLVGSQGQSGSDMLDKFRAARELMAKTHTVDDAMVAGTKGVSAAKFGAMLQGGVPLSGDQLTIAQFAKNFPKSNQSPETIGSPGVSKVAALAGLLGVGGHYGGGPTLGAIGAAAGAAAPFVVPPAVRGYQLSPKYQKGLLPSYEGGLLSDMPDMRLGGLLSVGLN